jgi:tyrosyl-tRNA synthetase
LVEGTDGRKMSSSWGNTINLNEKPNEMFGKVMSIRDELIIRYFTLVTRVPMKEVKKYEKEIRAGGNPRDYKLKLAYELVRFYHSEKAAKKAQEYFINIFSKKNIPSKSVTIKANVLVLHVALLKAKIITSKNELTRLVKQGGVKINNKKISDPNIKVKRGDLIQKGKRHFVKIV